MTSHQLLLAAGGALGAVLLAFVAITPWRSPLAVPGRPDAGAPLAAAPLRGAGTGASAPRQQVRTAAATGAVGAVAAEPGVVRARFVDAGGKPLPHVRLVLRGPASAAVESCADGRAELALPAGARHGPTPSVAILASHPACATVAREAGVPTDGVLELGTIVMRPGGAVEGVVVDPSGTPVARATVNTGGAGARFAVGGGLFADSRDRAGAVRTVTAGDGSFRLQGVLAEPIELEAERGGPFSERWLAGHARVEVAAGTTARVQLPVHDRVDPSRRVTLTVLDPQGQPVRRASVRIRGDNGRTTSTSLHEGRLTWLGEADRYRIVIRDPKQRWNDLVLPGVAAGSEREVRFQPAETFEVRVASAEPDRRIESVSVELREPEPSFLARLRGEHARTLLHRRTEAGDLVCRLPDARFLIQVEAFGHARRTFGPFEPSAVRGGVDLVLPVRPAVRGRVLAGGRPKAGATVALHRRTEYRTEVDGFPVWLDPNPEAETTTGDDGCFALTLRGEGTWFLRARAEGYAVTETEELGAADARREQRLELNQGGVIEGHLVTAGAVAGTVLAASRGDGFARSVRVGRDGSYRFERMTPGRWLVRPWPRELSPAASTSSTLPWPAHRDTEWNCEVRAGAVTAFDVVLESEAEASLSGRLLPDRDLSAAVAELQQIGGGAHAGDTARGRIGAGGVFHVAGLHAGRWRFHLRHGDLLLDGVLSLHAGGNRLDLAPEHRGAVALRGLPAAAAARPLFLARDGDGLTLRLVVHPDDQGRARATGLPPGHWRLERGATAEEIGTALLAGRDRQLTVLSHFAVRAGATATVDLGR